MARAVGSKLVQQFQPLRNYLPVQLSNTRDVAARPVKAVDETELDRDGVPYVSLRGT
jgi:hypothetical protein